MQTFSSAKRTCSASASAVEWTATERMPASRQARITRSAISPRLAMRTFLNNGCVGGEENGRRAGGAAGSGLREANQRLTVLHVLAVAREDLDHLAVGLGLDLVHQLHRLDDADHLTLADGVPDLDEGRRLGRGRAIERADERRRDEGAGLGCPLDGRRRRERDRRAGPTARGAWPRRSRRPRRRRTRMRPEGSTSTSDRFSSVAMRASSRTASRSIPPARAGATSLRHPRRGLSLCFAALLHRAKRPFCFECGLPPPVVFAALRAPRISIAASSANR